MTTALTPTYEQTSEELLAKREINAQEAFENKDFGSLIVTDSDAGWNRDGKYWSKRVYGAEGDKRLSGSFGIEFLNDHSDEIVENWFQLS